MLARARFRLFRNDRSGISKGLVTNERGYRRVTIGSKRTVSLLFDVAGYRNLKWHRLLLSTVSRARVCRGENKTGGTGGKFPSFNGIRIFHRLDTTNVGQ